jgi:integrase
MDEQQGIAYVVHYNGQAIKKLRHSWASARSASGLGKDVVAHTLRHTAATWIM